MRLMNVHQLELETFDHRNAPPYAILSHTWGDDEISYQTVTSKPEVKTGRGWAKILGTCSQAIRDKYDWVWIDTCNIDKSSSAELSEAINSMFVWYQRSAVCYALLEDVQMEDINNVIELTATLRGARWFSRGWTLQELIAPRDVIFYDAMWDVIGTKNDLGIILADITRIHLRVLQNAAMLSTTSIAQKMSWAADRQTTRVEDIAYCLLGLFGITMPLLYGEGSRAFRRLQEELINRFNDQTIFAWGLGNPCPADGHASNGQAWESLLGGGVLALHPSSFKDCCHIQAETRLDTATEPTAITTRGILIESYLMQTKDLTIHAWLLPCSSSLHPGSVVIIPLRTPSSRTQRYSRIATDIESIQYGSEAFMSNESYKQIYLKKAIEHNPNPISRICHLRSYPSHLIKPVHGMVADLERSVDGPLLTAYDGRLYNDRPWDSEGWTVDLGVHGNYNGVALLFKFAPCVDGSKYLMITMALPGPSLVSMTRHHTVDSLPVYQLVEQNLTTCTSSQDWLYIPECGQCISVQVDVEVEHGGIIYAVDVHFEPTRGRSDRFVTWKEDEDAHEGFFADHSVMLNVPEDQEPVLLSLVEKEKVVVGKVRTPRILEFPDE